MTKIHHLNCLKIQTPLNDDVIGHCLLLEDTNGLTLVETGIGLLDTQHPEERIGRQLIDLVGFRFDENLTAFRQIEKLGLNPGDVNNVVVSHLDPDHIGGLADFKNARVHVGIEEYKNFNSGNPRYLPHQLAHLTDLKTYPASTNKILGLEARKVEITSKAELFLVPLFGHTLGHCGILIRLDNELTFYVGDAYYLEVELYDESHPVNLLAAMRADNNALRLENLDRLKKIIRENPGMYMFSYHDRSEFPSGDPNRLPTQGSDYVEA